jgi:cell wall-associated NlpC family hydrolase
MHAARHHGKHYARLSHHQGKHPLHFQKALTSQEKQEMIEKIQTLAKASVVTDNPSTPAATAGDDSLVTAEASSPEIQSQIAQAAKEERAEDDVDVSIDQFFKNRSADPEFERQFQTDFTLIDENEPAHAAQRSDIMAEIIDWIGTRYYFGGQDRAGIDCSAFTQTVIQKSTGLELPRTAYMQYQLGDAVKKDELVFGDLVFFHTARYSSITHVGIYLGEGLFANAACSKGVTIASLSSTYWSKHFAGARRLFSNGSMAAVRVSATGAMAQNFVGPLSGNSN